MIALGAAKIIPWDSACAEAAPKIQQQLKYFSQIEYLIMKKIGERIAGEPSAGNAGPDDVNVALRADAFLAGADPEIQEQFHQLLTVFNGAIFTFFFDFRFSSFIDMAPADQDSYLESWMTSSLEFRRTAFQALKRTSLSMFYTDSRSWNEIHYDGMFLPWERGT